MCRQTYTRVKYSSIICQQIFYFLLLSAHGAKDRSVSSELKFLTSRPASYVNVCFATISLQSACINIIFAPSSLLLSRRWRAQHHQRIDIYTSRNRPTTEQLPSWGRTSCNVVVATPIRPGEVCFHPYTRPFFRPEPLKKTSPPEITRNDRDGNASTTSPRWSLSIFLDVRWSWSMWPMELRFNQFSFDISIRDVCSPPYPLSLYLRNFDFVSDIAFEEIRVQFLRANWNELSGGNELFSGLYISFSFSRWSLNLELIGIASNFKYPRNIWKSNWGF